MKVKIHEMAVKEFDDAIEWYELQSKGLGERFKKSVIAQAKKIELNPKWHLIEADNIYKAYVPIFVKSRLQVDNANNIFNNTWTSHSGACRNLQAIFRRLRHAPE